MVLVQSIRLSTIIKCSICGSFFCNRSTVNRPMFGNCEARRFVCPKGKRQVQVEEHKPGQPTTVVPAPSHKATLCKRYQQQLGNGDTVVAEAGARRMVQTGWATSLASTTHTHNDSSCMYLNVRKPQGASLGSLEPKTKRHEKVKHQLACFMRHCMQRLTVNLPKPTS